jgi:putative FmdB family regulatory protein
MPVYEYQCTTCSHVFEELVSASGTTTVACPQCTSTDLDKLLSKFQRSRGGGDMPAVAAGGVAPRRSGGCCGGGCGCGH